MNDFYYTIKRIYEQETGNYWSENNDSIRPTEDYMKWLENKLKISWDENKKLKDMVNDMD